MSHVIAFPPLKSNRSVAPDTERFSLEIEDQAIREALERECQAMAKTANYLEALCANLKRELLTGPRLSLVTEPAQTKPAVEIG